MTRAPVQLLIALAIFCSQSSRALADAADAFATSSLVQEVISRAESPHSSDWRTYVAELQLGIGYVNERNNFTNSAYELSGAIPAGAGSQFRFGLRRVFMSGTESTDKIARTPYKQAAQYSRYEIQLAYAFGLMQGRAMTRLSPRLPDFEHTTLINVGAHYNLPSDKALPQRGKTPRPMPGQQPVNNNLNLEIGLRWHVYTPQSFGFYMEAIHDRPLGNASSLNYWSYFSCGVLWSFGTRS